MDDEKQEQSSRIGVSVENATQWKQKEKVCVVEILQKFL